MARIRLGLVTACKGVWNTGLGDHHVLKGCRSASFDYRTPGPQGQPHLQASPPLQPPAAIVEAFAISANFLYISP